jgi:4-alpha-glucanotransferase
MKFCGHEGQEPPRNFDRAHEMILRGVMQTPSQLAIFMITDVFGTEDRFNVPGAVTAGNWSYRLGMTVRDLDQDPGLAAKTKMFTRLIKETSRQP